MSVRRNHSICAVAICDNPKDPDVVYHKIPQDANLRDEWIRACLRKDPVTASTASVCSRHFLPEDYERDLKNELLGLPLKRKLKKNAVPSQNLGLKQLADTRLLQIQQEESIKKENQKKIINELLDSNYSQGLPFIDKFPTRKRKHLEISQYKSNGAFAAELKAEITSHEKSTKAVQVDVRNGCPYKTILSRNSCLERKIERQKETIRCLKKKLKILTKTLRDRPLDVETFNLRDKWSDDDIANFLMLRAISPRAYNFIRKKQMCVLPSVSDLDVIHGLGQERQALVNTVSTVNELTIVHLGEEVPNPNRGVSHHDIVIEYEELQEDVNVYQEITEMFNV